MAMTNRQQNAFDQFMAILNSYGFTGNKEISQVVRQAILNGTTSADQLDLIVRQTDAWKTRFAGNEMLAASGQNVLSVAQYLATETAMAQVFKQNGLPAGFYDDPADFAKFIGNQVSASELQARVGAAVDLVNRDDPAINNQLAERGLSVGDAVAYFLDPERALPLLSQKYQSVLIGAAGERAGVNVDTAYADHLASLGIGESQAIQGYGTVADITKPTEMLGDIYGSAYTQADAEKEVFEGGSGSTRKKLASQERGAFSGASGTNASSLGTSGAGSY